LFLHHEKWNKDYKLEKVYGGGMGESKRDKSEHFTCLMAKLTTIIAQDIIANRQFRKTLISKWLVILGYNSIP
jgi:predicted small secreted protein